MENKIVEQIKDMSNESNKPCNDIANTRIVGHRPNRSSCIKELATALAKAQAEYDIAGLNKANPFFKSNYADYQCVVGASRHALTKHGFSVRHEIVCEDDASFLYTVLQHSSGQYVESKAKIVPIKNDIQSFSSYITYLKRLCYSALVGVVTGDEDDDGERAVASTRSNSYSPSNEYVSAEQIAEMNHELMDYPDIAKRMMESLKIHGLKDMPKSMYRQSMERIRAIKRDEYGVK